MQKLVKELVEGEKQNVIAGDGDNAETSTLVSMDIDRQKWSWLIFIGL